MESVKLWILNIDVRQIFFLTMVESLVEDFKLQKMTPRIKSVSVLILHIPND